MTSISCLLILLFILFLKDVSSIDLSYDQLKIQDQFLADSPLNRIDCDPEPGANQATCIARGCIYDTNAIDKELDFPWCYFPKNTGYISEMNVNSSNSIIIKKSSASVKNPYGQDYDELVFQSNSIGSGIYVSITPKGVNRYRPPVPIKMNPQISSSDTLNIIKKNDSIFSFVIQRNNTGTNIWDTSIGGLLFADKYIQIASYLPSDKIYGFGDHWQSTLKHDMSVYKTWGMWAKDNGFILNRNLYGVHPFYLGIEDDGNAHGVFIFNSNAQEVTLGPAPHLVYRTIGGQLEIFFFPGPTPEQVIQQYQQVIGTPFMPSYWALGFHLCRYGYTSTGDVEKVVNRTRSYNIPFDTQWADINYMDRYKDFTLDPTSWGDFGNYTNYLHQQGMHVMLITDPAIEVDYPSFQRGLQQNASFFEWPRQDMVPQSIQDQYPLCNGTKIMLGVVWPDNHVAFPDFLDPTGQTTQWWVNEFATFRQTVAIDGIWIDMNEPSNFNTQFYNSNSTTKGKYPSQDLSCPISGPDSEYDTPPYLTWSGYYNGPHLASKTVCLCAVTARGTQKHYDTHNLYGWSEMVATSQAQYKGIGKRGAVISRSTFPSSGVYGGHWTGDAPTSWDSMKASIIAIQEFNMFGIPFVGADVCGFLAPKPLDREELCFRWQQLGAFYPFFRNHNDLGNPDQDPGFWPSVAAATRKANLFRYRHLPYLYSLLFNASLNAGTVIRPVFFEFPKDPATYELSLQFMWGPALMIIPVTDPFVAEVNGYLPVGATWYSVYDYFYGSQVAGGNSSFQAPSDYLIPVFVRGGYIVPRQVPSITTTLSRQNPFQILVAISTDTEEQKARGELYWDDGETVIDNITTYNYYHFDISFSVQSGSTHQASVTINATKIATGLTLPTLDNIEILGFPYNPNWQSFKLNGNPVTINTAMSSYSPFTKVLNITTTGLINFNMNGPSWQLLWENS